MNGKKKLNSSDSFDFIAFKWDAKKFKGENKIDRNHCNEK